MKPSRGWCDACPVVVDWLTVPRVAAPTGLKQRTVYYWIERGWVHARQLQNSWWLICVVPGEWSSGEKQHRGRLTKSGNTRTRSLLVETWVILRWKHAQTASLVGG